MAKASQVSIDYHRSFRRTVTWRWKGQVKAAHDKSTRTDVVNLYHARHKGVPDRIAVKRILSNMHGTGDDFDSVHVIAIEGP